MPPAGLIFASPHCLLDDTNGAAVATRCLLRHLSRWGFDVVACCGTGLDLGDRVDPLSWLAGRYPDAIPTVRLPGWGGAIGCDPSGIRPATQEPIRLAPDGYPIDLIPGDLHPVARYGRGDWPSFLRHFETLVESHGPRVLLTYGGTPLVRDLLRAAKKRGLRTVFVLHNLRYDDPGHFGDVDELLVASRFAADHYRRALGLRCEVIPNLVDEGRSRAVHRSGVYATFVNPDAEKGVRFFARLADELGRSRPNIPLLVVEARGNERDLASCGVDLRARGNVFLMSNTGDPRAFWGVTKLCLVPSLVQENQPLVILEALTNGIPVVASDRGGIPEALGPAGIALPIPSRLTPDAPGLPTPEDVLPWIEAIIRLWDDRPHYERISALSLARASAFLPSSLRDAYVSFLLR